MQKRNNQTEILPNYFLFSLRCYSILSYGSKIHCSSAKIWWKIMLHKKYSWTCRKYPLFMIKPLCFTLFHPSSIVHITKFHRSPAQGALPQDCEAPALWAARPPLALPIQSVKSMIANRILMMTDVHVYILYVYICWYWYIIYISILVLLYIYCISPNVDLWVFYVFQQAKRSGAWDDHPTWLY